MHKKIILALLISVSFSVQSSSIEKNSKLQFVNDVKQLDRLIDSNLKAHDIEAFPKINDEVFLRRIYLDIIGRIPSYSEVVDFRTDSKSKKRQRLIDELLESEGYVSHQFNFFADMLRAKSKSPNLISLIPYMAWIKDSLRDNKPYDEFVFEMITSSGAAWKRGNGATGYYLRDNKMAADHVATEARVFLGTQIQCAQCHDHPFDKWTRNQFFQQLAFTKQIKIGSAGKFKKRDLPKNLNRMTLQGIKKSYKRLTMSVSIQSDKSSVLRLPKDYQYKDAQPLSKVIPKPLYGSISTYGKNNNKINSYAKWMTSPKNDRFTNVITNRLWKKVMGRALIEPLDNLTDKSVATNPKLMKFLEKYMVDNEYDIKGFFRLVYNSKAYQRDILKEDLDLSEDYHFPGPIKKRLSAEQIWDSVLTLTVENLDSLKGIDVAEMGFKKYEDFSAASKKDQIKMLVERSKVYVEDREVRIEIKKLNTALKNLDKDSKEYRKIKKQLDAMMIKRRKSRKERASKIKDEMTKSEKRSKGKRSKGKKLKGILIRASELPQPSRQGSFLRQLGQSDRQLIFNANKDPNVTQVLTFYNGFVGLYIINPNSVLTKNLSTSSNDRELTTKLFYSLYSRKPDSQEMRWVLDYIKGKKSRDKYKAISDVVWALINNPEFLFYS